MTAPTWGKDSVLPIDTWDEVEALRAILRKVEGSPRAWAGLSFVGGCHGRKSQWTAAEQEVLRRAGL